MTSLIPKTVWCVTDENRSYWLPSHGGTLTVLAHSLRFEGKRKSITISDIRQITFTGRRSDFINRWIKIDYGENESVWLADGDSFGWSGFFGGNFRLYRFLTDYFAVETNS